MISKNRSSRFAHGLAAAVLAVGFTAACGDDDPTVVDPDGGPDAPVEPCVGHLCPTDNATMELDEGGVIRYELFHVGYDAEGNKIESLGGWTFLFKGQQPGARPLLPAQLPDAPGCFDMASGTYFLSGNTPANQAIVDTRTYYDLGETLTLTGPGGAIPMDKQPAGTPDPSMRLQHKVMYLTDPGPVQAAALQRNVSYPVPTIAPVNDFPGLDLRGGFDVMMNAEHTDPPAMYFPADFDLDSPSEQDYFAEGGLQIDASQDVTFAWTPAAAPPDSWVGQVQFTGFLDENHAMKYLCLAVDPDADPNTQTLPAALFTQPNMPESGKIIHGAITHMAWAQPDGEEELRIDLLGVNCKYSSFTLNNLPAQ